MSSHSSFAKGFEKVATPAWFYEMNKTMNPLKSMKNTSTVGLKNLKGAKGMKVK